MAQGGYEALLDLVAGGPWKEAASQSLLLLTTLAASDAGGNHIHTVLLKLDYPAGRSPRVGIWKGRTPQSFVHIGVAQINIHFIRHADVAQQLCRAEDGLASVIACLKAGPNQSAAQHAANLLQVRSHPCPHGGFSIVAAGPIGQALKQPCGIKGQAAVLSLPFRECTVAVCFLRRRSPGTVRPAPLRRRAGCRRWRSCWRVAPSAQAPSRRCSASPSSS